MLSHPVPRNEIQTQHRVVIASFLAVGVPQSRVTAGLHSGGQVESLHAPSSDVVFLDVADDRFSFDRCY